MKPTKDKFSKQAKIYKKYRPTYPPEVYLDLLDLVSSKQACWDCGTGNGQVASQLAQYFDQVYATDISPNQLNNAIQKENIIYKIERAEQTSFADQQFDLITVAQAIHWFDFAAFNQEVKRVGKPQGIIAILGYGLLRITPAIDSLIDHFYTQVIGPYWNQERQHIDHHYATIPFDFESIQVREGLSIDTEWTVDQLAGYLNSWSSVQNFRMQHPGVNPVDQVMPQIKTLWKTNELKTVKFPIFRKVGRIGSSAIK